jgi:hypothetical protein
LLASGDEDSFHFFLVDHRITTLPKLVAAMPRLQHGMAALQDAVRWLNVANSRPSNFSSFASRNSFLVDEWLLAGSALFFQVRHIRFAPILATQFQLSSARKPTFSYDVAWDKTVVREPGREWQVPI